MGCSEGLEGNNVVAARFTMKKLAAPAVGLETISRKSVAAEGSEDAIETASSSHEL